MSYNRQGKAGALARSGADVGMLMRLQFHFISEGVSDVEELRVLCSIESSWSCSLCAQDHHHAGAGLGLFLWKRTVTFVHLRFTLCILFLSFHCHSGWWGGESWITHQPVHGPLSSPACQAAGVFHHTHRRAALQLLRCSRPHAWPVGGASAQWGWRNICWGRRWRRHNWGRCVHQFGSVSYVHTHVVHTLCFNH